MLALIIAGMGFLAALIVQAFVAALTIYIMFEVLIPIFSKIIDHVSGRVKARFARS